MRPSALFCISKPPVLLSLICLRWLVSMGTMVPLCRGEDSHSPVSSASLTPLQGRNHCVVGREGPTRARAGLDLPPRDGCGTGSSQTGSRALEAAKGGAGVSGRPSLCLRPRPRWRQWRHRLDLRELQTRLQVPTGYPAPSSARGGATHPEAGRAPPVLTSASSMAVPVVVPSTVGLALVVWSWSKVTMSTWTASSARGSR